ncbi:MAG: endonuclease domain-containing protein, partial [Conexibacteraceae bacterium]|nr:endonuclease domain-containing protein [Conexibacteraceae bacterium]
RVIIHGRRELERELVNGVPCTTVTQTLLDLAATESRKLVLRCLGQLDYERKLRPDAVRAACGSPWNGSAAMLAALDAYVPQLARTKSELEDEFIFVCQRHHIPLPKVNTYVHGIEVDCHWPELGLVVELDGGGNHSSGAQRHVDRRKEVKLRANGLTVVRYTEDQVFRTPAEVAADTLAQLEQRRGLA